MLIAATPENHELAPVRFDNGTPVYALQQIIRHYGSQRRMFSGYWNGSMPDTWERTIEDSYPPEIRIGMKPLA